MTRKGDFVRQRKHASGMTWIAVSLVFLAAGVLAGAVLNGRVGAWVPPVAGFVGYILAFRRGMVSWNADRIWREPTSADEEPEDEAPEQRIHATSSLSRPSMRVVR
jgi:hypothetical protein